MYEHSDPEFAYDGAPGTDADRPGLNPSALHAGSDVTAAAETSAAPLTLPGSEAVKSSSGPATLPGSEGARRSSGARGSRWRPIATGGNTGEPSPAAPHQATPEQAGRAHRGLLGAPSSQIEPSGLARRGAAAATAAATIGTRHSAH